MQKIIIGNKYNATIGLIPHKFILVMEPKQGNGKNNKIRNTEHLLIT